MRIDSKKLKEIVAEAQEYIDGENGELLTRYSFAYGMLKGAMNTIISELEIDEQIKKRK